MYAFGLVEGAVARIAIADAPFRADGPVASTAIDELLALLQTPSQEAVVVRIVSDLKVQGDEPIVVGPLEVRPNAGRFYDAARVVGRFCRVPATKYGVRSTSAWPTTWRSW